MLNIKLASDSIKVGTKVYTVAPAMKQNKYGKIIASRVKGDLVVVECTVMDIKFSMRYTSPDNWNPAVLLTLGTCNETIPGIDRMCYRQLADIPAEECFYTFEEARQDLKKKKEEIFK